MNLIRHIPKSSIKLEELRQISCSGVFLSVGVLKAASLGFAKGVRTTPPESQARHCLLPLNLGSCAINLLYIKSRYRASHFVPLYKQLHANHWWITNQARWLGSVDRWCPEEMVHIRGPINTHDWHVRLNTPNCTKRHIRPVETLFSNFQICSIVLFLSFSVGWDKDCEVRASRQGIRL